MFLVALLLFFLQDAAKLGLSLSPPTVAVNTADSVAVGIYFRNTGGKPLDLTVPPRIQAKLASNASTQPIELVRGKDGGGQHTLAPGEALFVDYAVKLPPNMNGRIVLQLEKLSAPPVVIEVDDAKADAAKAKAAEEKAAETKAAESKAAESTAQGAVPAQPTTQPESQSGAETPPASGVQTVSQANLEPGETPGKAIETPPTPIAEHTQQRFSAHEPVYFVGGDRPTARFQFSFKYQFIDPESPFGASHPWISSLRFAYTQTSLWDIAGTSQPFTDSSYKPELFVSRDKLEDVNLLGAKQFGLQTGFAHESNGRDGDDSRGINTAFVQPVLFYGDEKEFHLRVMPKIYAYLSEGEGNKDIADYRGNVDMRVVVGRIDGFELSALGRLGRDFDKGSLQLDATYPLQALGQGTFDLYLQGQFFTGYGESLLTYNQYTQSLRFGIGLSR